MRHHIQLTIPGAEYETQDFMYGEQELYQLNYTSILPPKIFILKCLFVLSLS